MQDKNKKKARERNVGKRKRKQNGYYGSRKAPLLGIRSNHNFNGRPSALQYRRLGIRRAV